MKKIFLFLAFLIAAPLAFADGIDVFAFDFNLGDIGETVTFTQGPVALVLSGWLDQGVRGHMWMKNTAPDEIGVGLLAEEAHEISGSKFVQANLSKILAFNPTSVVFTMNSIQPGENYSIFGSNVSGQLGTLLASNISSPDFTVPANFDFISVASGAEGNVLLNDVTVRFSTVPTPEPGTAILFLFGLAFVIKGWKTCRSSSSDTP